MAAPNYGDAVVTAAGVALMGNLDFGDVPAWGSFITTLGAFVAAVWAARTARQLYEREAARDKRAEDERGERAEEQKRSQAVQICSWFGRTSMGRGASRWCALLRNASPVPVYDVWVSFFYYPLGTEGEPELRSVSWVSVVPPTDEPLVVLPESGLARGPAKVDAYGNQVHNEEDKDFAVSVEFTDAAGRRWRRDIRGNLMELDHQHHPRKPPARAEDLGD
ncbi:hypothetical protein [Micromonospora chersina]|uniref:hypothetical protein n=1 Tax=Micromonospora chersina TaxID=47854 RepID=UPI00367BE746